MTRCHQDGLCHRDLETAIWYADDRSRISGYRHTVRWIPTWRQWVVNCTTTPVRRR